MAGRQSINISYGHKTFRQLPSTYCAVGRPSINFRQLFLHPGELLSNSISFPYNQTFCQHFVWLRGLPSTSINFPCGPQIIRLFPSTICAARRHSVNFNPLSTRTGDLLSTSVEFSCIQETIHQLPSVFLQPVDLSISVNLLCSREIFCQLSCHWETFRQLPSTFCVAG